MPKRIWNGIRGMLGFPSYAQRRAKQFARRRRARFLDRHDAAGPVAERGVDKGGTKTRALALAALGVVFGDIGTSPLYTFETALGAVGRADSAAAVGVASLIVWSLLLIVTLKYVGVVMRADYRGEGGVFALLALLRGHAASPYFS